MKPATSTPESAAAAERARFDAELLRRMGRSDREAFAQLYDRFSRPLYATALRILSNSAEAEDIVQDVFLALWEKAAAYEPGRGSAFAWAVTLTRNRAIDRVRMRKRRSELLAETTAEDAGTQPSDAGLHSADELVSKDPRDSTAKDFAVECRRMLERAQIQHIGSLDCVPRLSVALPELRSRSLDHQTGFLLSRVDGLSTLETLLDVCGMPRLDALRVVAKLVEDGILHLDCVHRPASV